MPDPTQLSAGSYIMDYQNRWSDSPETALDEAERFIDQRQLLRTTTTLLCTTSLPSSACGKKITSDGRTRLTGLCRSIRTHGHALLARGLVHVYSGEPVKGISYIEPSYEA